MENVPKQKGRVKKFLGQVFGWLCLIVGTLGLFLPFLQGVLLILIGVIFLSVSHPSLKIWVKKEFAKSDNRPPGVRNILKAIEKAYIKLVAIFGERG